jgi:hypothetical protein
LAAERSEQTLNLGARGVPEADLTFADWLENEALRIVAFGLESVGGDSIIVKQTIKDVEKRLEKAGWLALPTATMLADTKP